MTYLEWFKHALTLLNGEHSAFTENDATWMLATVLILAEHESIPQFALCVEPHPQ